MCTLFLCCALQSTRQRVLALQSTRQILLRCDLCHTLFFFLVWEQFSKVTSLLETTMPGRFRPLRALVLVCNIVLTASAGGAAGLAEAASSCPPAVLDRFAIRTTFRVVSATTIVKIKKLALLDCATRCTAERRCGTFNFRPRTGMPEFKLVQVNAKMWDEAANLALPTSNLGYGSATAATAATGTAPPSVASGAGASEFKQVLVNAKMWDKLWDESVTATASIVAATASIVDALTRGQESAKLLAVASSRAVASSSPVSSTSAMAAANKGSPLLAVQIPGAAHELDGSGATGFNPGASDGAGVCLPVDAPVHFPFLDPF